MMKPKAEWTPEELEDAAKKCEHLGFPNAAAILRRGYPAIAAESIRMERGLPRRRPGER